MTNFAAKKPKLSSASPKKEVDVKSLTGRQRKAVEDWI